MYKLLAPAALILLTSGCATTKIQSNHQETLTTLKTIESNVNYKLSNLEIQMSNQSDYIDSLEQEVIVLSNKVESLSAISAEKTDENEEEVVPVQLEPTPEVVKSPTLEPLVLGSIEKVTIGDDSSSLYARVDTGAATSSLNASDIQQFERNGKRWVKFHIYDEATPDAEKLWIESPIIRFAKIRQSTNSEVERRAVVELWVKLGDIHEKAQFTLADRSQMTNPVLLGREFIKDIALVDVSKKFIQSEEN